MNVAGPTSEDRLALADWRRRVATLYADVRALSLDDPESAHRHWRDVRERLFREHPQSPVPRERRPSFRASVWPYDATLRFEVGVEPAPPPQRGALAIEMPNSGSDNLSFARIGSVTVPAG